MQNEPKNLDPNLRADIQQQVEAFAAFVKSVETPGKPHGWVTESCGGCGRRGFVFDRVAVLFSEKKKRIVLCSLCESCGKIITEKRPGNRAYDRLQNNLREFGHSDSIETETVSVGFVGGAAGGTA